jgi:hypothetical protein
MADPTPHRLKEYVVMVGRLWGREISGPVLAAVSIVLAFAYGHYADNANATVKLVKYAAWLTGIISVLLVFVAQYKAWCFERERYEAEAARNIKPELRGVAENFRSKGPYGDHRSPEPIYASFGITFDLRLTNHRPVPTNIGSVEVAGAILHKVAFCSDLELGFAGSLEYGIAATVPMSARVDVYYVAIADLKDKEIDLSKLRIEVIDGFGDRHHIPIAENERIWLL